jgi:hypothetical protein
LGSRKPTRTPALVGGAGIGMTKGTATMKWRSIETAPKDGTQFLISSSTPSVAWVEIEREIPPELWDALRNAVRASASPGHPAP